MGKLAMASLKMAKQPPAPVPLVLISDPGQDLDDEMSYIMLRYLVKKGLVEVMLVAGVQQRPDSQIARRDRRQLTVAVGHLER